MGRKGKSLVAMLVVGSVLAWMATTVFGESRVNARMEAAATATSPASLALTATPSVTPTVPPEQRRFQRIGGIGGASFTVAVAGTHAFVGEGYRITVYDVSNPAQPTKVSVFALPSTPRAMQIVGDHLFVSYNTGLQILNIQDPGNLVEMGTLDIPNTGKLYINGSTAYLLAYPDSGPRLQAVDITDVTHPIVGESIDIENARALIGVGNTLYVQEYNNIDIVDISDSAASTFKGRLQTSISISDIAPVGTTLLIAGGDKLSIADVSNPGQPALVGAYANQLVGYGLVQVVGSTAYAIHLPTSSKQTQTLEIFDISTPTAPVLQQSIELPDYSYAISASATNVYVVGSAGLTIVGSANASPPSILGSVLESGPVQNVATDGTQTYVLSGQTLSIYPANDRTAPALLGQYVAPYVLGDITVVNGIAYLTAGSSGGLLTVDVHDGHAPVPLGRYLTIGSAYSIAVADNLAYIVDGYAGLTIVDVSNPAQPTLRGRFTDSSVYDIVLNGSVAYVEMSSSYSDYGYQLGVLDIRNPAQPSLITTAPDIDVRSLYQIADGVLYAGIATNSYTIELGIIDVHQPDAPSLLTSVSTPRGIADVAVGSGHAFILAYRGIEALDVQQPQRPIRLGEEDLLENTYYYPGRIILVGDVLSISNGDNGVVILSFNASLPPPSTVLLPIVVQDFLSPIMPVTPTPASTEIPF